ncbi:putative MYH7B protein, partial [Trypanosoma conorhini]
MAHFFKKHAPAASTPDTEEVEMLRQKVGTLEEVVRRAEEELREERGRLSTLQLKTAQWKEKVKELNRRDQVRIAELEGELKVIKTLHEAAPVPITAEMHSLLDNALATLRDKHERELGVKQQELNKALATVSARDSELAQQNSELKALQEQYIESQQRFTQELESLSKHHEVEVQQLRVQLRELDKAEELSSRIGKQQEEIQALERHSTQQAGLTGELQREIVELEAKNNKLQSELEEASTKLSAVLEKQRVWKEGVKNIKLQDVRTIQELREELEKQKRAVSTDTALHPSQEEKLQQWKEKVKHEKLKDMQKINSLTQYLRNSQQQAAEAKKLIHAVATLLAETPPKVSHCIEIANKFQASLNANFAETENETSVNRDEASAPTNRNEQKENHDLVEAPAHLRAQLEEAERQRAEVQRELERTGEELHVLREQSGSDAAELRAQLEEAVRQRAEVQRELERTGEELHV